MLVRSQLNRGFSRQFGGGTEGTEEHISACRKVGIGAIGSRLGLGEQGCQAAKERKARGRERVIYGKPRVGFRKIGSR